MAAAAAVATPKLAVVVSYCSNERSFINRVLQNALMFADVVVLAVGDRLYTGEPEDAEHVAHISRLFPDVRVVTYAVSDALLATPVYLHNLARKKGFATAKSALNLQDEAFWVLLLDGDEVPDGPLMANWWPAVRSKLEPTHAYKMANYWYFLDELLVSDVTEDSVLMVHSSFLTDAALSHERERDGIIIHHCLHAERNVTDIRFSSAADAGPRGTPMFHHYSWVRADRAALLRKVANWGHSKDQPWTLLINDVLDDIEGGKGWPVRDFVHGHRLLRLNPDSTRCA